MSRGRRWNREESEDRDLDDNLRETPNERWHRRPPPPPELGLQNIEWVVVDEADVLFGEVQSLECRKVLLMVRRS
jgi:hypothetical protein